MRGAAGGERGALRGRERLKSTNYEEQFPRRFLGSGKHTRAIRRALIALNKMTKEK